MTKTAVIISIISNKVKMNEKVRSIQLLFVNAPQHPRNEIKKMTKPSTKRMIVPPPGALWTTKLYLLRLIKVDSPV